MQDFWVFGYGSLMWRPGFDFKESYMAILRDITVSSAFILMCIGGRLKIRDWSWG